MDENVVAHARDDIIVVSDEAHRTQSGKLARNMRMALACKRGYQFGSKSLLEKGGPRQQGGATTFAHQIA